ncbi:hypothetical protein XYCOK13_42300 [Xylanibacillus composti]|uniref:Uncharacterized protein n=1 Tax=Xylanibacillus composti TaxID=1572762 RepID=A0A8J4M4Y6_9BACL|nr:hypothetical protein XYCOK13_42300 [Xylanibacillus composti]
MEQGILKTSNVGKLKASSDNNACIHAADLSESPGRRRNFEEADSGDNPALTKRIAAAHYRSLKVVGRHEHGNVIRHTPKPKKVVNKIVQL